MSTEPNVGWTEALGEEGTYPPQPRGTGESLFVLGREWKLSSCESRIKAQFEQWVRSNAKRSLAALEREFSPEEANALRSTYIGDLSAGHYNWDGRHVRSARGDMPGLVHLTYLLLLRCHPKITEEQVRAMYLADPVACGMSLRWALGNSTAAGKPKENPQTVAEEHELDERKKKLQEEWAQLNTEVNQMRLVKEAIPTLDDH